MRRAAAAMIVLVALTGCASLRDRFDPRWECSLDHQDGGYSVYGRRIIGNDGRPHLSEGTWSFVIRPTAAGAPHPFSLQLRQGRYYHEGSSDAGRVGVTVAMDETVRRTTEAVWLVTGEAPTRLPGGRFAGNRTSTFASLTSPTRLILDTPTPVYVAGFDHRGHLVFRLPMDQEIIREGQRRAAAAAQELDQMAADFRNACHHYEYWPIVIT